MGLFKEKPCVECGGKTNFLTRTGLSDGNILCSKCTAKIPSMLRSGIGTHENYKSMCAYMEWSAKELQPIFKPDREYEGLQLDTQHGIFNPAGYTQPIYLKISSIEKFNLAFFAEEVEEGFLGDKVTGKIIMMLQANEPAFFYNDTVVFSAKAPVKKKMFGNKYTYDNPPGMDEFLHYFMSTYENFADYEDEYDEVDEQITQALSLFMIDSMEEMTEEELKSRRNRLIKTFHPDGGSETDTKYAQKINDAYDILMKGLQE